MSKRPSFIKNADELHSNESFSYPGDTETFGTGAALSKNLGLTKLGVNYEVLAPGDRSSWPHAHSHEEEFVFVLEGTPQVWLNGELHDLKPGDAIGFPAGTGIAHCLINNSDQVAKFIVVGERSVPEDKIFYPLHPKRNEECKQHGFFWDECPSIELGPHDGWPDKKRPER